MYRTLAERYGWTVDYIASLTPYQQLAFLSRVNLLEDRTITFNSLDEYNKWQREQDFGK